MPLKSFVSSDPQAVLFNATPWWKGSPAAAAAAAESSAEDRSTLLSFTPERDACLSVSTQVA